MARSTRKTTAARRTTTSTTPASNTEAPENAPVTPDEGDGAESPANDAKNAAEADSGPSAGASDDDDTQKGDENAPEEGEEHDDETKGDDEPESAKEDESLNVASDEWRTDGNGNSLRAAVPARPTHTGSLFPFEYTEGELKNTIVTSERVYAQMAFYGTKRKGKAFAYPAGVVLPKSVLDSVVRDA